MRRAAALTRGTGACGSERGVTCVDVRRRMSRRISGGSLPKEATNDTDLVDHDRLDVFE
jgi:hypothetical protein